MRNARKRVHRSGEQDATVGLAGPPADDFREVGFAGAGIADQDDVGALVEELEVQDAEDPRLVLQTGFMMLEQERVDGVLHMQAGEAEAPLHGAAVARLQFQVGEPF